MNTNRFTAVERKPLSGRLPDRASCLSAATSTVGSAGFSPPRAPAAPLILGRSLALSH